MIEVDIHPDLFWYAKGVVAFIAAILLVIHMFKNSDEVKEWDQRLRYLTLFGYVATVTFASPNQARNETLTIEPYHVVYLCLGVLTGITAIVSMRASARRKGTSGRRRTA